MILKRKRKIMLIVKQMQTDYRITTVTQNVAVIEVKEDFDDDSDDNDDNNLDLAATFIQPTGTAQSK